jgi:hypothetical protein
MSADGTLMRPCSGVAVFVKGHRILFQLVSTVFVVGVGEKSKKLPKKSGSDIASLV